MDGGLTAEDILFSALAIQRLIGFNLLFIWVERSVGQLAALRMIVMAVDSGTPD
jgi:hypothetical protein